MYKKIFFISLLIFITFQVFGQEDDIEKAKNDIVNQINTHHKIKDCTCRKNELLLYNILSTRMSFHPTSNEGIITHEVIYINSDNIVIATYHNDDLEKIKKSKEALHRTLDFCNFIQNEFPN